MSRPKLQLMRTVDFSEENSWTEGDGSGRGHQGDQDTLLGIMEVDLVPENF